MGVEISFDSYLRSLVSKKDERLQDSYAQTDATDLFDFGLMAQTLQEQKERQKGQETQDSEQEESKIERFPVLDGIRKYAADHVLLVGRPGSGKSTALRKMLVDEAQKVLDGQSSLIPVLIELRSWRTSYIALIKDFFRVHKLRLDEATIDDLLFEGKLLLLVDGVNELPDARQDIRDFRKANADTPMIFTTRMLGVGGDLEIEKKLEMLPLTEPQMRQFVQMRLPEHGNQMLQQLGERLRKFGDTPLLLSMLCDVFQKNGRVPASLGAAFRDFANLHDGKLKEDVPVYEHSRLWWSKLLQQLAFAMMPQDRPNSLRLSIPRLEAEETLTRFLDGERFPKPRDYAHRWLEDLLKYHLIQVKLVGTDQEIEFRHQLIQEYYAAEYLLPLSPNLTDIKLQHSYLNYLDWTESLALMLELVKNEEQAVRVVRLALDVDLRLGARLAGAVKYEFQEKTVGLLVQEIDERKIPNLFAIELFEETKSDKAFEPLITALQDTDSYVRITAAKALGEIGSDKAVEPLITALKDTDFDVRSTAANVLEKIVSDKAVEPLITALKDTDFDVRITAARLLGKIVSDKAVEPLITALKDTDFYVRSTAARLLGKIVSDKAVEPLILALKDSNDSVRRNAADALGEIGSDKAVEPLITALKDTDSYVRSTAARLLGEIGSDKAVEPLITALKDPNDNVRRTAENVLGEIGSDKAVEPLIIALKDTDFYVRSTAARLLGEIGSDKAVEPLITALKDPNDNVRRTAAFALGKIGSDKAVEPLITALKDADFYVRSTAADALGKIGSDKAVEPLITALKDPNDDARSAAADALGKIGSDKAVEPLIDALKDTDNNVRRTSADALGKIGSDKAVEPLIDTLKDTDNNVRRAAADASRKINKIRVLESRLTPSGLFENPDDEASYSLVEIGDEYNEYIFESFIATLDAPDNNVAALESPDNNVRMKAEREVENIGNERIESLIQTLRDSDSSARWEASKVLVNIGNNKVVDLLIQNLMDENFYSRKESIELLGSIGNERAVEPLIQAFKDQNFATRRIVAEALGNIANYKAVEVLIQALEDEKTVVCKRSAEALIKIADIDRNLPTLTQQLPHLLTLIPTEASQQALLVITAIQSRCKYYNYDIAQTPLQEENTSNITSSGNTIVNIQSEKIYMSDTSKPNISISISGGQIGEFITGDKNVHGNDIGTQNNYYGTDDPKNQELAKELVEILQGIVPQISDPTSEAGKEIITAAAMEEIENKPTLKDRLVAAFKAGAFEAIKKIAKNDFVEVFLTAFKAGLEAKPKK